MERVWHRQYDEGVPHDLPASEGTSSDVALAGIFL